MKSDLIVVIVCSLAFFASAGTSGVENQESQLLLPRPDHECDRCRCFLGDSCWPSQKAWSDLNHTIRGNLIATRPLAAPCHRDSYTAYNKTKCDGLRNEWLFPETHYVDSASPMAPFFANRSCDPFQPPEAQCVVGSLVQYVVNVSCAGDVIAGIKFATRNNIRLVIRNTGHDYNGKSTGAGALGLWMHNLKSMDIIDFRSRHYTGKAIKMGAGVQGFEASDLANAHGLQIVSGECATVGLAGGYTQGGGHSALASRHGLAADQVLEWELVTGTGRHVIANRYRNPDLFWALSGGGGGTYGVVLSMTAKAHKDVPTSAMNLTFSSAGISQGAYYEAIATYHAHLPPLVDTGAMSVAYFTNTTFAISPVTAPDLTVQELKSYMKPLCDKLESLGINYTTYYEQFSGYLPSFKKMQGPIDVGIAQYGGRFIPRSVVEHENGALTEAFQSVNDHGGQIIEVALNASLAVAGDVYNAVNPGWRSALIDVVVTTPWNYTAPWEEMIANQRLMTDTLIPALAKVTPNGSCYLNEGEFRQPDFQDVFYGKNYPRLLAIKNKYDPNHIFYATTAVGSEYWTPQPDGRLCRST